MNKSELVSRLAARLGGDRTIATAALNGVLEEIESSVARGERVSLIGFGTFDRRERAARTGRNPQTGAAIQLGASVAPVFRPGAGFRSLLTQNGGASAVPAAKPVAAKDAAPKKKSGQEGGRGCGRCEERRQGRYRQGQQEGAEEGDRQGHEEVGEEGPLNRRAQACPDGRAEDSSSSSSTSAAAPTISGSGRADDGLVLVGVVAAGQHVPHRLQPGPLLVVALDHRPRRVARCRCAGTSPPWPSV